MVESINGLRIPEPELNQRRAGSAPSITNGGGKCRWEPQFDRLGNIDDGCGVYVVQEFGTSGHINTLWRAQGFNRLCEGFSLVLEGLLLVDTICDRLTVARPNIPPSPNELE